MIYLRNSEFDILCNAIDLKKHPEVHSIITKMKAQRNKRNKEVAEQMKERRKENPDYGHSKSEIERRLRAKEKKDARRKLGVQSD